MSRDQKPEPAEKVPDWCRVEPLSDGTTRVTPRRPADRWPISSQEEWRIGPDSLEVRRSLLGFHRVRRYSGAELAILDPLGSPGFGRSLVVQVNGRSDVLAIGDAADIRALGMLLTRLTGWHLRISRPERGRGSRSALIPLAGLFILGGCVVAMGGFRQYREGSALLRQPGAVTAFQLQNAHPNTPVVATGRIEGATSEDQRLVLYDEYIYRNRFRENDYWELAYSNRPDFSLSQYADTTPVLSGQYPLIRPPHRWTDGGRTYEGFRKGDLATVLGNVASDHDHQGLRARLVFAGTPLQLSQYVKQEGMLGMIAGFGSILMGSFLASVMGWRRRHRRTWFNRRWPWKWGRG